MKKHNALKVVLITILVFMILSWIFPAAYYSGEFVDQGRIQMGLFDLFQYPLVAIQYFGYVPVFLLFVGGFYGVLYKIPAYRSFCEKTANLLGKHTKVSISVIICLIALVVSMAGLQLALVLLIPFLVSVILLMGYDKKVAAYTIIGAMIAGIIGTTFSASGLGLSQNLLSLKYDYQILFRFILLVAATALVIFNVLMTIKRQGVVSKVEAKESKNVKEEIKEEVVVETSEEKEVKKTTKKTTSKSTSKKGNTKTSSKKSSGSKSTKKSKNANKAALKDEDVIVASNEKCACGCNCTLVPAETAVKSKVWPFVTLFILLFVLMVVSFISWGEAGFGVDWFSKALEGVQKFELFGFPLFSKLLGTMVAFGEWNVTELVMPSVLVLLILVIIYKIKLSDAIDGFVAGAKKAVVPAFIGLLMYTILVIVTYHPFQLTIFKAVLGMTKGFNIATTTLVTILASLFNGDIQYAAQSYMPYLTSVVTNADNYPLVAVIYQSVYGLTMLVAPTSLILMGTLSYLKISYCEWLKTVWKLLVELFVILLIIFIILALV